MKAPCSFESLLSVPYVDEASGVDIAPSGQRVTFNWNRSGGWEIYEVGLDGTQPARALTQAVGCPAGAKSMPRYSPDGRYLAYLVDENGAEEYGIWLLDLQSCEQVCLMPGNTGSLQPSIDWSPDGRQLAFIRYSEGRFSTFVMEVAAGEQAGRQARRICAQGGPPYSVHWSPDGERLAIITEGAGQDSVVLLAWADCRAEAQLLRLGDQVIRARSVCWSGDGRALLLVSDIFGEQRIVRYEVRSGAVSGLAGEKLRIDKVGEYTEIERGGPNGGLRIDNGSSKTERAGGDAEREMRIDDITVTAGGVSEGPVDALRIGKREGKGDANTRTLVKELRIDTIGRITGQVSGDSGDELRIDNEVRKPEPESGDNQGELRIDNVTSILGQENGDIQGRLRIDNISNITEQESGDNRERLRIDNYDLQTDRISREIETGLRIGKVGKQTGEISCEIETGLRIGKVGKQTGEISCEIEEGLRIGKVGKQNGAVSGEIEEALRIDTTALNGTGPRSTSAWNVPDGTQKAVREQNQLDGSPGGSPDEVWQQNQLDGSTGGAPDEVWQQNQLDGSTGSAPDAFREQSQLGWSPGGAPDAVWEQSQPDWSPDGSLVAYVLSQGADTWLAVMDLAHSNTRIFQVERGVHYRPRITPDGKQILFIFDNPRHPGDLWRLDLQKGEMRQLTFSLPAEFQPDDLCMPEQVSYPSLDGAQVPALLYLPPRPESGELPPAVVVIHGGPNWLFQYLWYPLMTYFASQGWVVLAPNYRGSTGYGRAWQLANRFELGRLDAMDVTAGADYLVQHGLADPRCITVTGRSHGGYLTMCCLAFYPERWKAGSAVVPFINWFTSHANSRQDLQHWDIENMGHPDTHADLWRQRSPFFFLERIQAPVQLICGAHDPRCPASEALQARDALLGLGKSVECLLYTDEGHTFLKRANVVDHELKRVAFLMQSIQV